MRKPLADPDTDLTYTSSNTFNQDAQAIVESLDETLYIINNTKSSQAGNYEVKMMLRDTGTFVPIIGATSSPSQPKDIAVSNVNGALWILDYSGAIFSYMDDP